MIKVKAYRDDELLNKVKSLPSFVGIPKDYWILGVRSNENTYNVFDDKIYIYKGETFKAVMSGTTHTGGYGILNFSKWDKRGVAHVVANEWYYDVWKRGRHKGKIEALIQYGPFKVARDNNKDQLINEDSWSWEENRGLNFHPSTYNIWSRAKGWFINRWSVGCVVIRDIPRYRKFIFKSQPQKIFTLCLIDEF